MNAARTAGRLVRLLLGGALVWLSGCGSTQEHRARQYAGAFAELSPSVQERVLSGTIALGDPPAAVYVALGSPLEHPAMAMPRLDGSGEAWRFLGELAGATEGAVRFRSQFESITTRVEDPQHLAVAFAEGRVVRMRLTTVDGEVLRRWP